MSSRSLVFAGAVAALAVGASACGGKKEASVGPVISAKTLTIYPDGPPRRP